MRLLLLTHRLEDPSFRVRWARFLPAFEERGFSVNVREIPTPGRARRAVFAEAAAAAVTVLHRRLLRPSDLRRLRGHAHQLVYDFDDALLYRPQPPHRSWLRARRFWAVMRAADLVLAGNRYLASLARLRASGRVLVFPSTVDVQALSPARDADGEFVAVWIGQSATLPHLETVRLALLEAGAEIPGFRLRVVADKAPPGVQYLPWSPQAEKTGLELAHVGLMPLTSDPFSRGKCGYKLLQYYAAGLPAIASPVGVNRVLAAGGALLARGPEEWAAALKSMAADPARRQALGAKGRRFVERRYSSARLAPRLLRVLERTSRAL